MIGMENFVGWFNTNRKKSTFVKSEKFNSYNWLAEKNLNELGYMKTISHANSFRK